MTKCWASYLTSLQFGFLTCEMGIIPTSRVLLSTMLICCRCSINRNYFPTLLPRTCSPSSLTFISPNPLPPIPSRLHLSAVPSHPEILPHLYSCYCSLFPTLWYTILHVSCTPFSFTFYSLSSWEPWWNRLEEKHEGGCSEGRWKNWQKKKTEQFRRTL